MLIILFSWLYIAYISLGMGLILQSCMKFKHNSLFLIILGGLYIQLLFTTFYAYFYAVDQIFVLLNFIIASIFLFKYLNYVRILVKNSYQLFNTLSIFYKCLSFGIGLLILIQSSGAPFIIDNESYYVQTIKWINHYGLVKGLANLHPFFGQNSGWHILQSSFNFNFLANYLNDLNGFILLIVSFFSIYKVSNYSTSKKRADLFIGLLPIGNLFLFLFIDSPSTDLPIFILSQVVFYFFLEIYISKNDKYLFYVGIICLLMILIKVTVFPIIILPIILLLRNYSHKILFTLLWFSIISFFVFCFKNYLISGYPLYPLKMGSNWLNVDWIINENVLKFYYQFTEMHAFKVNDWSVYSNLSITQKILTWLNIPFLHGFFNKLVIFLLLFFPFIIRKDKSLFWIYMYSILQFIILFITSPQYRFFFSIILFLGLYTIAYYTPKKEVYIKGLLTIGNMFVLILILLGGNFDRFTSNDMMQNKQPFNWSQIIKPVSNTKYNELTYKKMIEGNLEYHSPEIDNDFFWMTSDGPLPCVNNDQINFFKINYNHIPQLRTDHLKDGFISVPVNQ